MQIARDDARTCVSSGLRNRLDMDIVGGYYIWLRHTLRLGVTYLGSITGTPACINAWLCRCLCAYKPLNSIVLLIRMHINTRLFLLMLNSCQMKAVNLLAAIGCRPTLVVTIMW